MNAPGAPCRGYSLGGPDLNSVVTHDSSTVIFLSAILVDSSFYASDRNTATSPPPPISEQYSVLGIRDRSMLDDDNILFLLRGQNNATEKAGSIFHHQSTQDGFSKSSMHAIDTKYYNITNDELGEGMAEV